MSTAADVPAVDHVALRVEWADGKVYEISADQPFHVDLSIAMPDLHPLPFDAYAVIPRVTPASVELSFRGDPRHPIVMQTSVKSNAEMVAIDRAELDRLLAVATMYVQAFSENEMMTLPEKLQLQEVEAVLDKHGRRY